MQKIMKLNECFFNVIKKSLPPGTKMYHARPTPGPGIPRRLLGEQTLVSVSSGVSWTLVLTGENLGLSVLKR